MKPSRPKLTPRQRLSLLKEVLDTGKQVSEVCRKYGISRTIFYRLKKRYLESEEKDREKALYDLPSTPHHFRNLAPKEIEDRILQLVSENPAYSTHKISGILKDARGLPVISNKGVQNVFRRNNLLTYSQRLEYSKLTEASWKPRWRVSEIPSLPLAIWRMLYAPFATIPKLGWLFTRGQLLLLAVSLSIFYFYHLLASIITSPTGSPVGTFFASIALSFGLFFFIYSMKYYLSTILVLRFAQVGAGYDSSKSKFSGVFSRLGFNLPKGKTLNPLLTNLEKVRLDAGNRPFVSIHVALYNEKRVVERLIRACTSQAWFTVDRSQLTVKTEKQNAASVNREQITDNQLANYEVIIADDSTDETTEIAKQVLIDGGWTLVQTGGKSPISADFGRLAPIQENQRESASNQRESAEDDVELSIFSKQGLPTVKLLHRTSRAGFKGGALQRALEETNPQAEYIMVLDADFVPYPDTIEQFVKTFQVLGENPKSEIRNPKQSQNSNDQNSKSFEHSNLENSNLFRASNFDIRASRSNIAAVQGYQWHVLNKSQNWVTRGVRTEYAGSYVIERSGEEIYQGLKQIAGSVYMIRASVLRQFGWGISITEDFELTLRLYEAGYKVAFSPYIQAPAEAVSTIRRLIRQRMRWAEGASFNIKRMFKRMLTSPNLTGREKLEFLYLTPYYLQAAFFVGGTFSWFFAEAILGSRLPFWTTALGWSLVFTNLLALPLMNIVGMFLEESDERDYIGILSFIALSYIVVPFQAYAAIKGFLEKEEGPWFRTPKTGLITDTFGRAGFSRFFGNVLGRPAVVRASEGNQIMPMGSSLSWGKGLAFATSKVASAYAPLNAGNFAISPRKAKWVGKALLVFLLTLTITIYAFSKGVPLAEATQYTDPFYLYNDTTALLTNAWQLVNTTTPDTLDSTTNTTPGQNQTGTWQYYPGTSNTSSGTLCSSNPNGRGWIWTTAFEQGGTINSGQWTFHVYESDTAKQPVGNIEVCVYKVTLSGGSISTSSLLFNSNSPNDSAFETDILDLAVTSQAITTTNSIGPFTFNVNEYLYVEYWVNQTAGWGGGTSTSTFSTGNTTGATDPRIVVPTLTIPENVVFLIAAAPFIPLAVMWMRRRKALQLTRFAREARRAIDN